MSTKMFRLDGKVQHYAWGGSDFLPEFMGQSNQTQLPWAELWLGAHSSAPARVNTSSRQVELHHFLTTEGINKGPRPLPYLLKVLDVKEMLSIQVHPSLEQAKEGFQRENELGIPLGASHRNYKDQNHKPEMMVALSDFWLLHGFKSDDLIRKQLAVLPELRKLRQRLDKFGLEGLYKFVMELPQGEVNELLEPLARRIVPLYMADLLGLNDANYWAAKAMVEFGVDGELDRGIFSVYLLNLVYIPAGKAIFQGANLPHAYLHGQNIEIMANSDNVLRGGLTPKHIDTRELLNTIDYQSVTPKLIDAELVGEKLAHFPTPYMSDFELHRLKIGKFSRYDYHSHGPVILLALSGEYEVVHGETYITLAQGESMLLGNDAKVQLNAKQGGEIYFASAPAEALQCRRKRPRIEKAVA